ncbi:MAG: hypothetical protein E7034_08585 [Akkermansiaceae bacterium]|nr:hypothetical protein [Akkermansiaceae bacterium]
MMSNLPRKSDINVYGTLEEIDAVRDFYGKTREEIYQVLLTDYECLQEELAFMGSVAFTYYAPAWERLFAAFPTIDETDDVTRWTKCIVTCRCFDLENETQESIAALRRMLSLCEAFYHSQACRKYYTERYMLPDLEKEQDECAKLHALLYPAS